MGCGASAGAPYREDTKAPEAQENKSTSEEKRGIEGEEKKADAEEKAKSAKDDEQTGVDEEKVRTVEVEERKRIEEEEKKKIEEEEEKKKIEADETKKREAEEENKRREENEKKKAEEEEKKRIEAEEERKRREEEAEKKKQAEEEAKRTAEADELSKQTGLKERREKEVSNYNPIQALGDLKVDADIVVTGPGDGKRACTIVELDIIGKVKVHYKGFKTEFDEWLQKSSYRIFGIQRESSIQPLVEAAVAFHKKLAPMKDNADKICNDFKVAAINGEEVEPNSENLANKILSEHRGLGLDAVQYFYQAMLDFVLAVSGTNACWFSSQTEGISDLVDAFTSAFCKSPKMPAFTVEFQYALLQLKGIFKEDGGDGDEKGPWSEFE